MMFEKVGWGWSAFNAVAGFTKAPEMPPSVSSWYDSRAE